MPEKYTGGGGAGYTEVLHNRHFSGQNLVSEQ